MRLILIVNTFFFILTTNLIANENYWEFIYASYQENLPNRQEINAYLLSLEADEMRICAEQAIGFFDNKQSDEIDLTIPVSICLTHYAEKNENDGAKKLLESILDKKKPLQLRGSYLFLFGSAPTKLRHYLSNFCQHHIEEVMHAFESIINDPDEDEIIKERAIIVSRQILYPMYMKIFLKDTNVHRVASRNNRFKAVKQYQDKKFMLTSQTKKELKPIKLIIHHHLNIISQYFFDNKLGGVCAKEIKRYYQLPDYYSDNNPMY